MKVTFNYPRWVDVLGWEREHNGGRRPHRWPYGIDGLDRPGLTLGYTDINSLNPMARRVPYRYEFCPRPETGAQGSGDVSLYWDERSAASARSRSKRGYRVGAGVIWMTDDAHDLPARAAARHLQQRLDFGWVLSTAQAAPAAERLGLPAAKMHHLPFGVDADFFTPAVADAPSGSPVVVSAGRDRDRDGNTLMAAFARISGDVPGVRFRYQDSGPATAFAGAEPFHGVSHTEMRDIYRGASVVVIATRPNLHVSGMTVALEAMACGTPVVMTETPGTADYVKHGVTGLLVPPGDPEELARATRDLLSDPATAQAFGRAGREHVLERHTSELMCRRLADILAVEA